MGDEFDQYLTKPQDQGDEFDRYRRDKFAISPETRLLESSGNQGLTSVQLDAQREGTLENSPAAVLGGGLVNPRRIFPGTTKSLEDAAFHREAQGKSRGLPGMALDAMDTLSSFTSPLSLATTGTGALTKAFPAVGILTKPAMAATGAGFGIAGAHDIYDAMTDRTMDLRDRIREGFLGGSQVAGGGAGALDTSLRGTFNPVAGGPIARLRNAGTRVMDIAAPGEPFTPREIFDSAAQHGINLDLADTTGARTPKMAKAVTQHSLAGGGPFERRAEANMAALDDWGNTYLDNLSRRSGEAGGARIQEALKRDYELRRTSASREFNDLDQRVGGNSIQPTPVENAAQQIVREMKPYYDKHPELVPREAWKIVNSLAERQQVQVVGRNGAAGPWHSEPFSWSELHQLRSDLMDIYRNNPDLVKSRGEAWLQRMVQAIDNTMTGAASGLNRADQAQFRLANDAWESLKDTYDNPQNPLYHAVRAQNPSQVAPMLMNVKAPEFARQLNTILGPEAGNFQRAVAEAALRGGAARGGEANDFRGLPRRLKAYPAQYLTSVLGPAGVDELGQMARIGGKLTADINPSGSGKLIQKFGEMGAIGSGAGLAVAGHPLPLVAEIGGMAAQRGISGVMNSPRMVRFLTDEPRGRIIGTRGGRGLSAAAAARQRQQDQDMAAYIRSLP